ncbi:hypothetical protein Plhal304r1_c007g0027591 [Plasmopara halstedii]
MLPQPNRLAMAEVVPTPTPSVIKCVLALQTSGRNCRSRKRVLFRELHRNGQSNAIQSSRRFVRSMRVIRAFRDDIASKNLDIERSRIIDSNAYFGAIAF